jgi:hypothetical protein
VVGVVIQDPSELSLFAGGGEVRVKDPESGLLRRLAITGRSRRRFAATMAARREQLTDAFYDAGMDHAYLADRAADRADDLDSTRGPSFVLEPLMELFSARRRAS